MIWVFPKCIHWVRRIQWQNICHYSKRVRTCNPSISCARDQDANTATAGHVWETGSLNWAQFMLQWFIRFSKLTEFPFYLEKNSIEWLETRMFLALFLIYKFSIHRSTAWKMNVDWQAKYSYHKPLYFTVRADASFGLKRKKFYLNLNLNSADDPCYLKRCQIF